MKGFTIANLILHMFMVLIALFLALVPSGAALVGSILVVFLPFLTTPHTVGALMVAVFFVVYAVLSLIFGIVDFLVISPKHPRAYFVIEILLSVIGAAGCTMALIFYYEVTSFPVRLLISRGIGPVLTTAGAFLFLCLLNLAFTVLYAVLPRKKITPVPVVSPAGDPGIPGASGSSVPLVADSADTSTPGANQPDP